MAPLEGELRVNGSTAQQFRVEKGASLELEAEGHTINMFAEDTEGTAAKILVSNNHRGLDLWRHHFGKGPLEHNDGIRTELPVEGDVVRSKGYPFELRVARVGEQ